jgi:hypothetical protein
MRNIGEFIYHIIALLRMLVVPIIGLAVVAFLYGLLTYIANASNEAKRKEGLQYIMYGLIGFVVMLSMWALAGILSGTFNLGFGLPQISI